MKKKTEFSRLAAWLIDKYSAVAPDFVVGGQESPYMRRWFIIPRNPLVNIYLHQFLRSDDPRALHDHPWASVSILLRGRYREIHAQRESVPLQGKDLSIYTEGAIVVRLSGKKPHRIELRTGETCWTLFITGPRYREWGFHCPKGWVPWYDFVDPSDRGGIGKGCGE